MEGTAGQHDFSDSDRSSEDETAVNISDYEGMGQELLQGHNLMNNEFISFEQSGEALNLGNLEGFRAAKHTHRKDRVLPPRPITREGYKAMIRLAARDGVVSEIAPSSLATLGFGVGPGEEVMETS
ncbi:hypothetical protein CRYUN_Cryun40dG0075900 [Craigia yunnanensis]